jgi:hypothetical protein
LARDSFLVPASLTRLTLAHPPAADIGTFLADTLLDLPHDVILVVDDYHLAASVEVENFVAGLLQFMPPAFHLALSTRNDPSLPLARMRLHGQIVEIRGEDLRFTDETRALLATSGGRIGNDPVLATQLRQMTDGWVAGLATGYFGADETGGKALPVLSALLHLPPSQSCRRCSGAIGSDGPDGD